MRCLWTSIERAFAAAALVALGALVLLPFTQVVLRDAFNSPLGGLEEATRWGLIALVYLALPLLVSTNEQIRFDEIVNRLPRRVRVLLERLHLAIAAIALGILINAAIGSALQHMTTRTPMLNIPFWLFVAPMVIGLAATAAGAAYFALRPARPPLDPPATTMGDVDFTS